MHTGEIKLVATHDGMRYTFDKPKPGIVGDSLIIGVKDGKSIVIRMSDVRVVHVEEPGTGKTLVAIVGVSLVIVAIAVLLGSIVVGEAIDDAAE
jgi:hypothetical protein